MQTSLEVTKAVQAAPAIAAAAVVGTRAGSGKGLRWRWSRRFALPCRWETCSWLPRVVVVQAGRARSRGFTLMELVVVLVVLAVLVFLLMPSLAITRQRSLRIECVNNLKQIGLGMRIFSSGNGNRTPMQIWTQHAELAATMDLPSFFYGKLSNELSVPKVLVCPSDNRVAAQGWGSVSVSNLGYFIGLQADEMHPQSLMAGDRNLTTNGVAVGRGLLPMTTNTVWGWGRDIHQGQGNVVLGDGSVQQTTSARLQQQVGALGGATNWLAVP